MGYGKNRAPKPPKKDDGKVTIMPVPVKGRGPKPPRKGINPPSRRGRGK